MDVMIKVDNQDRFNRYIVECKYVYTSVVPSVNFRFNRYIVECKFFKTV